MKAIYVDKHLPNMILTKAIAPLWPGFVWTPLSASHAAEFSARSPARGAGHLQYPAASG